MDIYVTSKSEIKLNAALHAFSFLYPDYTHDIYPLSAPSLVAEQPRERAEIVLGAENRLNYSVNKVSGKYIVSIENGLIYENEKFLDVAYIIISDPQGNLFFGWSDTVQFPEKQAALAYYGSGNKTAGQYMQEDGVVQNHTDPHIDLVGISRKDILQKVIIEILQINKKT